MMSLADALRRKGEVEARNRQLQIEAENAQGLKFVMRDVALKALDVLPEVTRELMAPAQKISEIKVLQTGSGGAGPMGTASPILKTILEAGAAYPLVKELVNFAQNDPRVSEKAKEVIDELTRELGEADPADAPAAEEAR
ncbi:MAG TPA: flotillin domain-containing protein, partial [Myxococcota bacterium]|nr:flotillin domain-containing protein [Myxococcota bacterium]